MKLGTTPFEVLLLACAMVVSGFWWFGDGRYRDQAQQRPDHQQERVLPYRPIAAK